MFTIIRCSSCLRKTLLFQKSHFLEQTVCATNKFCTTNKRHTKDDDTFYDVVIAGGGMVGAAMAAALGHNPMFEGMKIVQLEASPEKKMVTLPEKYSNRVSALSPGTVSLLNSFGAWDNVLNMRCQPVKRMQVWDSCSDSLITFNQKNLMDDLAYIVENDVISAAINQQIEKVQERVNVRYLTKVKGYRFPSPLGGENSAEHWAEVDLETGEKLSARLLIGADGWKSLVRQTANIHTLSWDYKQFGVVATLKLAEDGENNVAWQRFLPTGPVALLPLSDTAISLVWTTTTEHAKTLLDLSDEAFVDALNTALWSDEDKNATVDYATQTLDGILNNFGLESSAMRQYPPTIVGVEEKSRAMFPLGFAHASQYVKSRVALIGDAAHRIHPLAGQGVNLGFGDVACLVEILSNAVHNGADIGALPHLLEYETQRQRHVIPTAAGIDGLQRLYGTDWTPVVMLRSLGLQITNALSPLKERFMEHATK